jgi:two-component system CheB/CheR fusion protein
MIAVGASVGGLEAFRAFLEAVPDESQMAFILVQHLAAGPDDLTVALLASHTRLPVHQARDGMIIQAGQCYVIPPARYLTVAGGCLRLSAPPAAHGARMPFDVLLRSLAADYGSRAACVVLSGTGADGSVGSIALAAAGGLVLVQDPAEAAAAGMPRSTIAAGKVDAVLPVAEIPAALLRLYRDRPSLQSLAAPSPSPTSLARTVPLIALDGHLDAVLAIIHKEATQDFHLYKSGTLLRRIARRMALTQQRPDDLDG